MKPGNLVTVKESNLSGILFQDGYNLMILWSNGFIENSCAYFEHELEVINNLGEDLTEWNPS